MTEQIARALAARIRALDWAYQYTDDYTVYCEEKRKIECMRRELSMHSIELNNEILKELLDRGTQNDQAISFMKNIIAKQLLRA